MMIGSVDACLAGTADKYMAFAQGPAKKETASMTRRACRIAVLLVSLFAASSVVRAAERDQGVPFNIVSLQAEASREVQNDQMRAILSVEAESTDPAQLARQINETMTKGIAIAKQQPAIKVKSGVYQTYPVYRFSTIDHWRARQDLELDGENIKAMTETIGKLQSVLHLSSIVFTVTPETRRKIENELITEGLQGFRQRADLIRSVLGAKSYRIKDLNVETGPVVFPQPYMALAAAKSSSSAPAPALEAGTTRIQITVSGSIQLIQPQTSE